MGCFQGRAGRGGASGASPGPVSSVHARGVTAAHRALSLHPRTTVKAEGGLAESVGQVQEDTEPSGHLRRRLSEPSLLQGRESDWEHPWPGGLPWVSGWSPCLPLKQVPPPAEEAICRAVCTRENTDV